MIDKIKNILNVLHSKVISPNAYAEKLGVKFGKNCDFGSKYFDSEPYLIEMGDNVSTSQYVNFVTHDGSMRVIRNLYPEYKNSDFFGKIKIGNNVFIGIGVTVLPHTTIGDNVIVGAGSIVKGELKANSVYAGVPAKFICTLDAYVEKNSQKFDDTKHMSYSEKKAYFLDKNS